jgi:hypothetical protein
MGISSLSKRYRHHAYEPHTRFVIAPPPTTGEGADSDTKEHEMTEPVDFASEIGNSEGNTEGRAEERRPATPGEPSNEVYARVGDTVLRAAQDGVRSGKKPEDIIRQIVTEHKVRLTLGEFRLLLAARRIPPKEGR